MMYSLIIVDYNSIDATIAYIQRCWKALGEKGASHVVIVENGSNKCVPEKLQHLYGPGTVRAVEGISQTVCFYRTPNQEILYCHSGENMGYARGNNLGVRIAQNIWNDPYYIVSNNDLVFEKPLDLEVAGQLFEKDPAIGIIGPRVTTPDGLTQSPQAWAPAFRRLIVDYWRRFIAAFLPGQKKSEYLIRHCNDVVVDASSGPCAWVSGCFMLLRASAFQKAGMFDEHTFLYAEEMILSRRMEAVGSTAWYCRELEVIHNHAQTTKKTISVMRGRELDFRAVWYYYKTYTKTSPALLTLAKGNFAVYKFVFNCFQKLKGRS